VIALLSLVIHAGKAGARVEEHETVKSSQLLHVSPSRSHTPSANTSASGGTNESTVEKYDYEPSPFYTDSATPNSNGSSQNSAPAPMPDNLVDVDDDTKALDDVNQATANLKEIIEARAPASEIRIVNVKMLGRDVLKSVLKNIEDSRWRQKGPEEPE
jgi:hypothetical protein